jgi:hypothetical protein
MEWKILQKKSLGLLIEPYLSAFLQPAVSEKDILDLKFGVDQVKKERFVSNVASTFLELNGLA